jgi:hypothetical protein
MVDEKEPKSDREIAKDAYELGGGIFSEGQYEYLIAGGCGLSDSAIRHRRNKIRDNFQNAIFDLHALSDIEDRDIAKALEPVFNLIDKEVSTSQQSKIAEGYRHDTASNLDNSDIDKEDLAKGFLMLKGIRRFFEMFATHYGDELFLSVAAVALRNKHLRSGESIPNVEVSAKIDEEVIKADGSADASVDIISKIENLE